MIDLHTHTIFSDGELIPAELARRAEAKGVKAIGMTDHGDFSNMDFILPRLIQLAEKLNPVLSIKIIPGIEITHVPPDLIATAVKKAKELGARIVIVHGETIVEPVAPGTNRAAISAGVDILAHPGLITEAEMQAAKDQNVLIEISARRGHSLTNGHVAHLAEKVGTKLVINTDAHSPGDLIDRETAVKIVLGAGLTVQAFARMQENASVFL